MLFDFYQKQMFKKPGCLHATYLIAGYRKPEKPKETDGIVSPDGGDSIMQSSPFMSSMPEASEKEPQQPVATITLVTEEALEEAKASFEDITCIHIYSLEPGPLEVNMTVHHRLQPPR